MLHSCGAVLYTIKNNRLFIVLGKEGYDYYHFKGCTKNNETFEETAIREIYEETFGLVKLKNIMLECKNIKSKKKKYHLGLIKVKNNIVENFNELKKKYYYKNIPYEYKEKEDIKLFSFNKILKYNLHILTLKPILFFYRRLEIIQNNLIYKKKNKKKNNNFRYNKYFYLKNKYKKINNNIQ